MARLNQFFKDIYLSGEGKDPRALIQWITQAINRNEGYRFRNILAYKFRDFNFEVQPGDSRWFTLGGERAKQIEKGLIKLLRESANQRISQHERNINSPVEKLEHIYSHYLKSGPAFRRDHRQWVKPRKSN